jgi:lysophospholipase L1-like esterase
MLLPAVGRSAQSSATFQAIEGVEFDARNQPGTVLLTGPVFLHSGQVLVLSPTRDYDGKPLLHPRVPHVIFDMSRNAALWVESGARLEIEGDEGQPISLLTEPADPAVKPLVNLADGATTDLKHVSFINIALRLEGDGHPLSDVSVQFAGDQPAFTFAGVRGTFDHLFAHQSTWGFSFEPFLGKPSDLTIRDSTIRSCAKGHENGTPNPSTYFAGGSMRSIPTYNGRQHRVRFVHVDWDPLWDDLRGTDFQASGQRPRIATMGDSIGQGCCGYVNFWNYLKGNDDIENSWPYQLQHRIPEFFVINKGEGGFLSADMMARLPGIIEKIQPKYVYLGGSMNDIYRTTLTPEQMVGHFRMMWLALKKAGIVPIQLAITPQNTRPFEEDRIRQTNALLSDACKQENVRFEDVYSVLAGPTGRGLDPAYDPGDGIHPNKKGYVRIAQSLFVPVRSSAAHGLNP